MDCYVDTCSNVKDGDCRKPYRGQVVHTATGMVLFTTWPYASERSALYRAFRWLKEEYQAYPRTGLFKGGAEGGKNG